MDQGRLPRRRLAGWADKSSAPTFVVVFWTDLRLNFSNAPQLLHLSAAGRVTLAIYWPARRYGVVYFDDPLFVTDNEEINAGLTWHGLWWALPGVLVGTLAAAQAEAGRFDDAISTAQKAIALAQKNGEPDLLQKNQALLEFYRQHKAYRDVAENLVPAAK
jgi:hypothetical protein